MMETIKSGKTGWDVVSRSRYRTKKLLVGFNRVPRWQECSILCRVTVKYRGNKPTVTLILRNSVSSPSYTVYGIDSCCNSHYYIIL